MYFARARKISPAEIGMKMFTMITGRYSIIFVLLCYKITVIVSTSFRQFFYLRAPFFYVFACYFAELSQAETLAAEGTHDRAVYHRLPGYLLVENAGFRKISEKPARKTVAGAGGVAYA